MFKDRTFNTAIILSIMWHIFWLSIITVVVTPKESRPIKFPKVSFLGPILEKGALEVRLALRERSFLEKRYLAKVQDMAAGQEMELKDLATKEDSRKDFYVLSDGNLTALIEKGLSSPKLKPVVSTD
jgi:type II secretory pathway component PulC